MNEKTTRYVICGAVVLAVFAVTWLMFGGADDRAGDIDSIESGLERTQSEQRRAEESLARIEIGIERGEGSAGRIEHWPKRGYYWRACR